MLFKNYWGFIRCWWAYDYLSLIFIKVQKLQIVLRDTKTLDVLIFSEKKFCLMSSLKFKLSDVNYNEKIILSCCILLNLIHGTLKALEHKYVFLKYSWNLNILGIFWSCNTKNNFPITFPKNKTPDFLTSIKI